MKKYIAYRYDAEGKLEETKNVITREWKGKTLKEIPEKPIRYSIDFDNLTNRGDHFVVSEDGRIFREFVSKGKNTEYTNEIILKGKPKEVLYEEVLLLQQDNFDIPNEEKDYNYYIEVCNEWEGVPYKEKIPILDFLVDVYKINLNPLIYKNVKIDMSQKYPFSRDNINMAINIAAVIVHSQEKPKRYTRKSNK